MDGDGWVIVGIVGVVVFVVCIGFWLRDWIEWFWMFGDFGTVQKILDLFFASHFGTVR
jgi:hypothetical protein